MNDHFKAYPSKEEDKQETTLLNEPGPSTQPCQSITDDRPQTGGDRRKWETGAPPVVSVAQYTLDDTCSTIAGNNSKSELKIHTHTDLKTVLIIFSFFPHQCPRQRLQKRVPSLVVTERSGSQVMFLLLWLIRLWRKPVLLLQVHTANHTHFIHWCCTLDSSQSNISSGN